MLSEQNRLELDRIVEEMAEDFDDIRANNDGEPLERLTRSIERSLEGDRYIMRRLYEKYPDCGNRIPLYLATHAGRIAAMNLIGDMVNKGPEEVIKVVRLAMMAPLYSAIWNGMQAELVEEELGNI